MAPPRHGGAIRRVQETKEAGLAVTAYGGIAAYTKLGLQLLRLQALEHELDYIEHAEPLKPLTRALWSGEYAIVEWMRAPKPGSKSVHKPNKKDFIVALRDMGLGADHTNAHSSTHYADFAAGVATMLNALHEAVWQSQLSERPHPGTRSHRLSAGAISLADQGEGEVLAAASPARAWDVLVGWA